MAVVRVTGKAADLCRVTGRALHVADLATEELKTHALTRRFEQRLVALVARVLELQKRHHPGSWRARPARVADVTSDHRQRRQHGAKVDHLAKTGA